ncbi:3',5'-cyclic-AMP phosphodiesterase [Methylococcus sp. EFPC2]|uniref:3',5'-cyclic-AMP phosphodiesterase n=1 Tax=Methylococcus sp. EFPC2 TaxID=2812648 RepID=UPI0019679B5B|nr:3',5'-cyclic-AMP phosphodiesterase [Methylococcus sp. EFPC2]QSA97976.1 3',5'-cyclic-AMP phosphodiesterase [Methylococcus sp. EFPC2]
MTCDRLPHPVGPYVRIVQLTDFHLLADPAEAMMGINTDASFRSVLAAAHAAHWPPDLCLLTGDLAQEARPQTYRRLRAYLEELGVPCYCLPGNHDSPAVIAEHLAGASVFYQRTLLLPDWQIVFLDSTIAGDPGGFLADEQLAALEDALLAHPDRHVLVALHHSPLATGSQWLDTMRVENAEEFLALLARYPRVRAVVYGHVHQAMDERIGDLRLIAAPSTCFQFKPASGDFALDPLPPGYRWIELYPDGRIETGVERVAELPAGLDMASAGY